MQPKHGLLDMFPIQCCVAVLSEDSVKQPSSSASLHKRKATRKQNQEEQGHKADVSVVPTSQQEEGGQPFGLTHDCNGVTTNNISMCTFA